MTSIDLFLAHYGYFAIFALLMLGIVGPLIPDETILVLSGVAVHRGQLDLALTISVAFAGSLCGITLSYILGRTGAIFVLERVLERFGPTRHWTTNHLPQVQRWFERYGKWTLFFGYFIAGVRHFTALTAGISRLEPRLFAAYAYPGALVWVVCFVAIGYFLGDQWERIHRNFSQGAIVAAAVLIAIGLGGWWIQRKRRIS